MNVKTALIILIVSLLFIVWLLTSYKKVGAGYNYYSKDNCESPTASPSATLTPTIEVTPTEEATPTVIFEATEIPQSTQSDGRSDGRTDGRSDGGRSSDFEAKQAYSAYDGSPVIAK